MSLTSSDNYFEDFQVGNVYEHTRGKTMTEMDQVLITNMVMNSASSHYDAHHMKTHMFKQRVAFGGVTIGFVVGMCAQDCSENVVMELGLDKVRLKTPVFHGDTLYASSEVLEVKPGPTPETGEVLFRHRGRNERDEIVFEGERRVLIKRRPAK